LFTLELLLETESVQLLLHESRDAVLYLLDVVMIIVVDLTDLSKDTLFLLRAAELREPLSLSSFLLLLFAEVSP
jgi:hypothetical protein